MKLVLEMKFFISEYCDHMKGNEFLEISLTDGGVEGALSSDFKENRKTKKWICYVFEKHSSNVSASHLRPHSWRFTISKGERVRTIPITWGFHWWINALTFTRLAQNKSVFRQLRVSRGAARREGLQKEILFWILLQIFSNFIQKQYSK